MAATNSPSELASGNPCCLAWQQKYIGMKNRRDAFKEAVTILQNAITSANAEKSKLEKKLEEMVADRDTKANDSVLKSSLEKEILGLKSEILSLQQRLEKNLKEKSEETKRLQEQASIQEKEINELKDLLKKESLRADNSEEAREQILKELNKAKALIVKDEEINPHAPEGKAEITLVQNLLASERQKTESERKKAESEKTKADQYLSELEVLRTTARKTSSDLLTLTSKLETVKKQLEFEKQKTLKEKKRADMESAKAREQMKLAEGFSKNLEIVKARNEELKKEMQSQSLSSNIRFTENSAKLEEKIKLLEMDKKIALDWKSRADNLTRQLQEAKLVTENLKKQVHELSQSQKSIKTRSISPQKVRDLEKAEMRLLKKKVKFERNCAKHSEKVANFERFRREFQAEELGRLKQEFGSVMNRMNVMDAYYSRDVEGTTGFEKLKGCTKVQTLKSQKNCHGEKHSEAKSHLAANPGSQEQARKLSAHLIPKSGQNVNESDSGTISQLKSPTGCSKKLESSGVISSATSFSDGQLLASQGREQFSVTTAENAKDKPNIQPTKSNVLQQISDTSKNGNLCLVAGKYLQSRTHEVVDDNSRKRKRMLEAFVTHNLSSGDKKKNFQIGEKMGTLQPVAVGNRPLEKGETLVPDRQGGSSANGISVSKKRRVSCKKKTIIQNSLEINQSGKTPGDIAGTTTCLSIDKGHDGKTLFPEDFTAADCMKLLELDNSEEERHYQMARESFLSPDLPQIDFLDDEIMSEDKNPDKALDIVASNSMELGGTVISNGNPSLNTQNDLETVKMPPKSTTLHDHILKHLVVFSNIEDQDSNKKNLLCPFSDKSSSLESMASKLIQLLQEFIQSNTLNKSLTGSSGSSHLENTEYRPALRDFQCVVTKDQSFTLCDIMSSLELIACYTAWDWTNGNIVAPLLKMLELPLPMYLFVAVISHLGQLSSIGVDSVGYENESISNLRVKLSALLRCETTLKAGLAVQIAVVGSLLKTMQLKFPTDFQDKAAPILPGNQSLSGSVNLITKWLSLLSHEQKVFTFEFFQNL